MAGRLGALAALFLVALPVAASAEGIDLTIPDGYMVAPSPSGAQLPRVFRVWDRRINGARHSIVASAQPADRDLAAAIDANVAAVKARDAIDVSREDAGPLCGAPSARLAYAYANQLTYVYRYTIIAGRLLVASYAHPVGTAADPAALAALDTLCSGVHQARGPSGWDLLAPFPGNGSAWMGPNLVSGVIDMTSPAKPGDTAPEPFKGKGTVTAERQELCGTVPIRRVTATNEGTTVEFVAGILRGYSYTNQYKRVAADPADPDALAALTSFCAETAAPSATPAPRPPA